MARSGAAAPRGAGALLAAAAALALGALIALPWEKEVDTQIVRDTTYDAIGPNAPILNAAFSRSVVNITAVDGTRLEAWLFLPQGLSK